MLRTPKEELEFKIRIFRDLATQNRDDEINYEKLMKTEEWAVMCMATSRARATTYEIVADELQELLDEWEEEGDDGK